MIWSIRFADLGIDRDHPFGVELAERDFQPAAVLRHVVDTVELEVEQFPDPTHRVQPMSSAMRRQLVEAHPILPPNTLLFRRHTTSPSPGRNTWPLDAGSPVR